MWGSSGYRARYFFRNPPSKSASTPSMSTRTRSRLPGGAEEKEEEDEDMSAQIRFKRSRSEVFRLPSRRAVPNSDTIPLLTPELKRPSASMT
ncbi:hypothetical protein EYF80_046738 [Liparis tanakae]|uniref:Uncharacterized protein n=1 Tax=Liparis tanakae TaxID=230148 RepID=A0A4Z2FPJ7_9TELE|nr:hypothetical protein EYF80_046738 [Liparis tanakae]